VDDSLLGTLEQISIRLTAHGCSSFIFVICVFGGEINSYENLNRCDVQEEAEKIIWCISEVFLECSSGQSMHL